MTENKQDMKEIHSNKYNYRQTKESLMIDIPSIILNNLVDENGDIKDDGDIPQELIKLYEQKFPRTNKQQKLKRVTTNISNFSSIPQSSKSRTSLSNKQKTNSIAQTVGLTEQIMKAVANQPSLFLIKEFIVDGHVSNFIFNKIEQPLVNLPNIINLTLTNHQIEKIENLSFLTQLKKLNLSGNKIKVIERLESLKNLIILDLSNNQISKIPLQVFSRLAQIEELNLSNNQISDVNEIKNLVGNKALLRMNTIGNIMEQDDDYTSYVSQTLMNLQFLDNKPFLSQIPENQAKQLLKKKRAKSEGKLLFQQDQLYQKLNQSLEKKLFNQKKKIQKQNQELSSALEYVNGLEEELLNVKINALFTQSVVCSPKGESQNQSNIMECFRPLISPQPSTRNNNQNGLCNPIFPNTTQCPTFPTLGNMTQIPSSFVTTNNPKKESIMFSPKNENISIDHITKNLNSAFSEAILKQETISPSQIKFSKNDQSNMLNTKDSLTKMLQEKDQLQNKKELVKTKLSVKQDQIKQGDYELKGILMKLMDLNSKVNIQCDNMSELNFESSIQNLVNDRIQYIKKYMLMKLEILKKKNKNCIINEQMQFLILQISFYQNNDGFSSQIAVQMQQQISKINQILKMKQQKLQNSLLECENKLKLTQEFSKQEILDQSIYDFYSRLLTSNQNKQVLKQNEYDLQKWLKKFAKQEKIFDQKLQKYETQQFEQINLIKDLRNIDVSIKEKISQIQIINDKELLNKQNELQNKINNLNKRIKSLESEKKKLTQRILVKKNENIFSQGDKSNYESVIKRIEQIEQEYQSHLQITNQQLTSKNTVKLVNNLFKDQKSFSPQQESIGDKLLIGCQKLIEITEFLKIQLDKKTNDTLLQQPLSGGISSPRELEAYLCSTSILEKSANKIEAQLQQNLNASIMKSTLDTQPNITSFTNNANMIQVPINEYEYYKNQTQMLKQQLYECEQEKDTLQIEFINKKENYEQILKNIRIQISEKEQKYSALLKELKDQIQELMKQNQDQVKVNSDLIRKVCCYSGTEIDHSSKLTESSSKVKRLEWYIGTQSKLIESILKEKCQLESRAINILTKQQQEIAKIPTNGTFESSQTSKRMNTNELKTFESFQDKQFTSFDYDQIQKLFNNNHSQKQLQSRTNLQQSDLIQQNTENNMIQHLFTAFQQKFLQQEESFKLSQQSSIYKEQNQQKPILSKQKSLEPNRFCKTNPTTSQNTKVFNSKKGSINSTKESGKSLKVFPMANLRCSDIVKSPLQEINLANGKLGLNTITTLNTDYYHETSDFNFNANGNSMYEGIGIENSEILRTGQQIPQEYSFNNKNINTQRQSSVEQNNNFWTANPKDENSNQHIQSFGKTLKVNKQNPNLKPKISAIIKTHRQHQ